MLYKGIYKLLVIGNNIKKWNKKVSPYNVNIKYN